MNNGLIQEHADWVTAIRTDKPVNTAKETALATLIAIMGRDSAYSGKAITWDELMTSTTRLGPTEYTLGPVPIAAGGSSLAGVDHGAPLNRFKSYRAFREGIVRSVRL